ncbi:hypothetical protein N8I84_30205 [Streptomyces cynarae]|uniref:Uncharacterized protein n=1 Tax=Streptomyces cynarae TaxID=2981134 RepID=A0ABY6E9M4_9ACTN|nr:hypothetical protein [Streptomyces cynarae]UXY22496.1 hypothetical protein N8I84_30205 [Streptomyces cynarae]
MFTAPGRARGNPSALVVIYLYERDDRGEGRVVHGSGADGGREKATAGSWWAAAVANLLIGMLAIVPGVCVRWLLNRYALLHCVTGFGCGGTSPDQTVGMTLGAVLGGGFILGMVLVVDVLMPWQEGRPLHLWLGMTTLVPAPFAVAQAAGWI